LLLSVQKNKTNYIIGLEHPAVVTLGYRASASDEIYDSCKLPLVRIGRGGLATVHAEGQLVIYPVLNLRELGLGVRDYVMLLLETIKELLARYQVDSFVDEKAVGLYTEKGKIAFCGIQIKNGVTQHGLSLNVNNDLKLFSEIRSCGVSHSQFDSLFESNVKVSLKDLYSEWIEIFRLRFQLAVQ
jgi:lipoyl(octanoyl) transferase